MVSVKVSGKSRLEFAIRVFRKACQKANIVREARRRKNHEKSAEKRKRKREESAARNKRMKRRRTGF